MLALPPHPSGAAYAHRPVPAARAAASAAEESLALDPVYTAKAMAGLLSLCEEGRLEEPVLFIHTDGPRADLR
jgi:1-aminocyclopropane-1-carboxylate deaminase/D-cysteine desulfhydrase-like pyridoxal-dependent ACC family enzyme